MKMTANDITPAVKSAVNAYLLARTHAEVQRNVIDGIKAELLREACYYTDDKYINRGRTESIRITDPKDDWMLRTDEFHDYLANLRHELENRGYEIKTGPDDVEYWSYYCPALVAENLQRTAENILIDCAAEMMGIDDCKDFRYKLVCAGLDKYRQFIDLVVGLVVNLPDFRNPLMKVA